MDLLFFVQRCMYFMLPAYFANMIPVIAKKMNFFNFLALPLDGGKKIRGEPVLGSHKTVRGFLLGSIGGALIFYVQAALFPLEFFRSLSFIDYSEARNIVLGSLFGFFSLIGDALGSFLKRRLHKNPGEPFIPIDQISLVFGGVIFIPSTFISLTLVPQMLVSAFRVAVSIVVLTFCWHIVAARAANFLQLRTEKW